jgi:ATP-binding cassette subfamily B protein
MVEAADARPRRRPGADARFEGVGFGYDAERPVLDGSTSTVAPGSTVALIGRPAAARPP